VLVAQMPTEPRCWIVTECKSSGTRSDTTERRGVDAAETIIQPGGTPYTFTSRAFTNVDCSGVVNQGGPLSGAHPLHDPAGPMDLVGHAFDTVGVFAKLRLAEPEHEAKPHHVHGNPD
jgi:hypothetical protein